VSTAFVRRAARPITPEFTRSSVSLKKHSATGARQAVRDSVFLSTTLDTSLRLLYRARALAVSPNGTCH